MFTSELQAAIATTETGALLATMLHELDKGALTAREALTLREAGRLTVKLELCIDAMSVWSALSTERIKTPAEHIMLLHLLWL